MSSSVLSVPAYTLTCHHRSTACSVRQLSIVLSLCHHPFYVGLWNHSAHVFATKISVDVFTSCNRKLLICSECAMLIVACHWCFVTVQQSDSVNSCFCHV